jgi:RNA polymerase sigma factor for flagellar operon FliA
MQKATRRRGSEVGSSAGLAQDALPLSMIVGLDVGQDSTLDAAASGFGPSAIETADTQSGDGCSGAALAQQPAGQMQEEDIAAHLSMVRFLARRIHERLPSHVELEELVGAGVLGLMDAYKKFNPEKKVKFRSYAQFRVRGAILDSLRTLDWSPRELRRKAREIEAAIQRLTGRVGRSPNELEVAAELKITLADYQHLLGDLKSLELGTLNAERSEDSGEEELAYVPNRSEDDPLFQCLRSEVHGRLRDAIDQLPERERMVLNLYYFEELTMKEIGQILGVVESRISQVHASAVLHMRAAMQAFHR